VIVSRPAAASMRAFVTPAAEKDSRFVSSVSAADEIKQPLRVKNQREARPLIFISVSYANERKAVLTKRKSRTRSSPLA
jgi:hypothetical protein